MISNPRPGMTVQVWYGAKARAHMPHHGAIGIVVVASKGRPRNHLVEVPDARRPGVTVRVSIPAGNLRLPS